MIIIYFILGLIVGSFLNVVIARLQTAESILGRSHCPKCEAKIRWYDNIPLLSYVILRAKCRDCQEKISLWYPVVEGVTGVIFALTGYYFFDLMRPETWLDVFYFWIIFSILIVIFVYDFKHMEIPMIMVWLGIGLTVIYYLFNDWVNFSSNKSDIFSLFSLSIFSGLVAGVSFFLFFFALSAGSREKFMGIGDAYVALLIGLIAKWPAALMAFVLAFMIGAVYGIILIALKKKTFKSQVPFAPFLVLGGVLTVFFYKNISLIYAILFNN